MPGESPDIFAKIAVFGEAQKGDRHTPFAAPPVVILIVMPASGDGGDSRPAKPSYPSLDPFRCDALPFVQ